MGYTNTMEFDAMILYIAGFLHATYDEVRAKIDKRKSRNDFSLNGHDVMFIRDKGNYYHCAVEG